MIAPYLIGIAFALFNAILCYYHPNKWDGVIAWIIVAYWIALVGAGRLKS